MTTISEILDVALLQKHLNDRLVSCQTHPTLPLLIYNYTTKAAFANVWGDGTIDYCRGLIVDCFGQVVARPFKKFHNLNTEHIPETLEANLPLVVPNITEKMDGSLGILWRYDNQWGIATRGSFTSHQAKWATCWYENEIAQGRKSLFSTTEWTPLFEIIYNENRIVCKYDFEGLVLLGMVDKKTGAENLQYAVEMIGLDHGFAGANIVKDYSQHANQLPQSEANREGYVLTFDCGCTSPLKVKVKFGDYVRLHRIVTGVSPKAIWELLALRQDRSFIQDMPEHFRIWADKWVDKLYNDFSLIYQVVEQIFVDRPVIGLPENRKYRAVCAEYFKRAVAELEGKVDYGVLGVLFALLDGKRGLEVEELIWHLVKPRGDDTSFRTDGE